jgi:cytochrome b pre-mRNA-processing protein 3
MRSSSVLLYESISDKLMYREWFSEFDMPDTFNSWFLVTELHCWLVLTRVMNEGADTGQDGRFIRNTIVETMWSDVQTRAKKLSADNPSASRGQVSVLAEQFQATLINYDEGLMSDDKILASALWRRFFNMQCDDYEKLEKLVKYVRRMSHQLDSMTREQLLNRPKIEWEKISE